MERVPNASANMPVIGPEAWDAVRAGGILASGPQQQGILPNRLTLTPQMIEQIMRQMASQQGAQGPQQGAPQMAGDPGTLEQLQQAQRMMGVGGVRGPR